jgi:6-phosphogluconolactonase (cycloisomerase 2 family)
MKIISLISSASGGRLPSTCARGPQLIRHSLMFLVPCAVALGLALPTAAQTVPRFVYVAGQAFTGGPYSLDVYSVDSNSGALTLVDVTPVAHEARAIAADPNGQFVYVAGGSSVSGFAIDPATGTLTPVDVALPTGGDSASAITVDPSAAFVYIVTSAGLAAFTRDTTTGVLSDVDGSPFPPGGNSITADPSGQFLYMGRGLPLGAVSGWRIDPTTGAVTPIEGSPFDVGNHLVPSVGADPSGRFLFATSFCASCPHEVRNYAIDPDTGALTLLGRFVAGINDPTALAIDPYDRFMYMIDADAFSAHGIGGEAIDMATGALTRLPLSGSRGSGLVATAIDPSGTFFYTTNLDSRNVSVFTIDPDTGHLVEIDGSPFAASVRPFAIVVVGGAAVLDTTPPVIVSRVAGTLGNNGWYTSDVTVSWDVSDPESGIASSSGCGPTTLTADTASVTLTCTATNGVGLTNSVPVTIAIDKTPPVITGMPPPGCTVSTNHKERGNRDDRDLVQVAIVSATDAPSGMAPGSFMVTGTSNDPSDPRSRDIVITANRSGGFIVHLRAENSGDRIRIYTLRATARDMAGNSAIATATCTVAQDRDR